MKTCLAPIDIKASEKLIELGSTQYISVPCGRCPNCLERKRNELAVRTYYENEYSVCSTWCTLTYQDKYLPINAEGVISLKKRDVDNFLKRLRTSIDPIGVRYLIVGEYGDEFGRPHYHCALFFDKAITVEGVNLIIEKAWSKRTTYNKPTKTWNREPLGHVHFGLLESGSIYYTIGYMLKKSDDEYLDGEIPPFRMMSRGLGIEYCLRNKDYHIEGKYVFVTIDGTKRAMPEYFKKIIFEGYEDYVYENSQMLKRKTENREDEIMLKMDATNDSYFDMSIARYNQKVEKLRRKIKSKTKTL